MYLCQKFDLVSLKQGFMQNEEGKVRKLYDVVLYLSNHSILAVVYQY